MDTPLVECAVFFTVLLETRLKMKNYVSLKTGNVEFDSDNQRYLIHDFLGWMFGRVPLIWSKSGTHQFVMRSHSNGLLTLSAAIHVFVPQPTQSN